MTRRPARLALLAVPMLFAMGAPADAMPVRYRSSAPPRTGGGYLPDQGFVPRRDAVPYEHPDAFDRSLNRWRDEARRCDRHRRTGCVIDKLSPADRRLARDGRVSALPDGERPY